MLASSIEATQSALTLFLKDGNIISIPWENCSHNLAKATAIQRHHLELSPGGYGIHWPLLDEDFSVQGLVNQLQQS